MTQKKKQVDIHQVLADISSKDVGKFAALSAEEMAKIPAPIVLMRWMYGTRSKEQILRLNDLVNTTVFHTYKHPRLLVYSMMVSAAGKGKNRWIPKAGKSSKKAAVISCISEYLDCTEREARETSELISLDDVLDMATEMGYSPEEISKIKKCRD